MEASFKNLAFLYLFIMEEDSCITTDLYSKETDIHEYLDFRSCHPSHTKQNIPYMVRRICTIIADPTLRKQRLDELKMHVHIPCQNYPENLIDARIKKLTPKIPISEQRNTFQKEENANKMCLSSSHINQRNHKIPNTAKRFFQLLEQSTNMKKMCLIRLKL
jgi:hypothetical protein